MATHKEHVMLEGLQIGEEFFIMNPECVEVLICFLADGNIYSIEVDNPHRGHISAERAWAWRVSQKGEQCSPKD